MDEKRRLVTTLFDYDRVFLENLSVLMDRYLNPLRQAGTVDLGDFEKVFKTFDQMLIACRWAVTHLQPATTAEDSTPYVIELFCGDLFTSFQTYLENYIPICNTISSASSDNDRLSVFLEIQRQNVHVSLLELIRQPLEQLQFHCQILSKFQSMVAQDSEHYSAFSEACGQWDTLNEIRQDVVKFLENESKLMDIEASFPHDRLRLVNNPLYFHRPGLSVRPSHVMAHELDGVDDEQHRSGHRSSSDQADTQAYEGSTSSRQQRDSTESPLSSPPPPADDEAPTSPPAERVRTLVFADESTSRHGSSSATSPVPEGDLSASPSQFSRPHTPTTQAANTMGTTSGTPITSPAGNKSTNGTRRRNMFKGRLATPFKKPRIRRFMSIGGAEDAVGRRFVKESSVKVSVRGSLAPRRFILLSDTILIGKAKNERAAGKTYYHLKARIRLRDAWVVESPHEKLDKHRHSIVLGCPLHRNLVIGFSSKDEREKWFTLISDCIAECKHTRENGLQSISILTLFPGYMPKQDGTLSTVDVDVHGSTTVAEAISSVLTAILLTKHQPSDYVLFERTKKKLIRLEPYECPLPIIRVGMRLHLHDDKCPFVLRHISSPLLTGEDLPPSLALQSKKQRRESPRRKANTYHETRKHSSSSLFKKMTGAFKGGKRSQSVGTATPSSKAVARTPSHSPKGALYGKPLDTAFGSPTKPPPAVVSMLQVLYFKGPITVGIFRKSANARLVRNVRESLNAGDAVDIVALPALVCASAFKEYLRSIPNCLIHSRLYDAITEMNSIADQAAHAAKLRDIFYSMLCAEHLFLLRCIFLILERIADQAEFNQMTTHNLSVCIGASMLWPQRAEDVLSTKVPDMVKFVIENRSACLGDIDVPFFDPANAPKSLIESISDGTGLPPGKDYGIASSSSYIPSGLSTVSNTASNSASSRASEESVHWHGDVGREGEADVLSGVPPQVRRRGRSSLSQVQTTRPFGGLFSPTLVVDDNSPVSTTRNSTSLSAEEMDVEGDALAGNSRRTSTRQSGDSANEKDGVRVDLYYQHLIHTNRRGSSSLAELKPNPEHRASSGLVDTAHVDDSSDGERNSGKGEAGARTTHLANGAGQHGRQKHRITSLGSPTRLADPSLQGPLDRSSGHVGSATDVTSRHSVTQLQQRRVKERSSVSVDDAMALSASRTSPTMSSSSNDDISRQLNKPFERPTSQIVATLPQVNETEEEEDSLVLVSSQVLHVPPASYNQQHFSSGESSDGDSSDEEDGGYDNFPHQYRRNSEDVLLYDEDDDEDDDGDNVYNRTSIRQRRYRFSYDDDDDDDMHEYDNVSEPASDDDGAERATSAARLAVKRVSDDSASGRKSSSIIVPLQTSSSGDDFTMEI